MDDLDALLAARAGTAPAAQAPQAAAPAADPLDAMLEARATSGAGSHAIEYSEGPATAEQAAYQRVNVAGTSTDAVKPIGFMGRTFQGMKDPANAISQMAYNALPAGGQDAYRALANWGAEKAGMDGRIPEGGADAMLQAQEQQYQANRLAANGGKDPGFDGGRMLGNLASPVNVALAAALPTSVPTSLAQILARGGVAGVASGLERPVTDGGEHFWDKKGEMAGKDGIFGMGGSLAGSALARVLSPKVDGQVKALMDEGITPTAGQIMGGGWAKFEDKMGSFPIIGDMIKNSQRRGVEDFNRAAYNRALSPIGETSGANIGRAGVEEVQGKLGQAYDNLLPKLNFRADSQLSSELNNLTAAVSNGNVPPAVAQQFDSIVKNEVVSRMTKAGTMDGQSFKDLESVLTQKIKAYGASMDPAHKDISAALSEVLKSARSNLERSNPQYAGELGKINEGWANYARIRQAAAGVGANEGVFTPAQLQSAVKALDKSAGKGQFATGNALMQDLSEGGKSVLGSKYPDSGTPGRAMVMGLPAAALAAYNSPLAAGLVGGAGVMAAAPYSAMGQKLAAALLAKRPAGAESVANAVRALSPLAGSGFAPLLMPSQNK